MVQDIKNRVQEKIDLDTVDRIVENIKKKYEKKGISDPLESERLKRLRSIIAEGNRAKIEVQKPEELEKDFNPNVKFLGRIYNKMKFIFKNFSKHFLEIFPSTDFLALDLDSANIKYSSSQYLAMASVIVLLASIFITIALGIVFFILEISLWYSLAVFFIAVIFLSIIALRYPAAIAKKRARYIDAELPFALRHMATELRAGIGLYRVLQSIAMGNYSFLSEEFARAINEIEQGADTKDALKNLSFRVRSMSLRNTINHILRALKTGGKLSEVLNETAKDVSFNIRLSFETFAGKMNFVGVIFIFIGIVLPVMLAILGTIRNVPLGGSVSLFSALPLSPGILMAFYIVILPLFLLFILLYIRAIRPIF